MNEIRFSSTNTSLHKARVQIEVPTTRVRRVSVEVRRIDTSLIGSMVQLNCDTNKYFDSIALFGILVIIVNINYFMEKHN